jgi:predicted DNA-binding protein (MmcQ/YjbR family)
MNLETFRKYCLSQKGATEDFPFDEETLVFRVGGKIFALTDTIDIPFSFNLKCDPERGIELREEYQAISPGWHMNKKHWNTIIPDDEISDKLIKELIDHSYKLVFDSLKKAEKDRINRI